MPTKHFRLLALFAALMAVPLQVLTSVHEVPLMRAGGGFQQGFVRVEAFNVGDLDENTRKEIKGDIKIEAWDDAGVHAETTLEIHAGEIKGFNSNDLEFGNVGKGLPVGLGSPTAGDWRLRLSAGFGFDVNAYVRTGDGFVTSLDSTLRAARTGGAEVSFFNPARNQNQRSWLRIINDAEGTAANVTVEGMDDSGAKGKAAYSISVPPLNAVSVDARDLEGAFGEGTGKWRLRISSNPPARIVNFLETPTGHLTSLEPVARRSDCRVTDSRDRLPIGVEIGYESPRIDADGNQQYISDVWGNDIQYTDYRYVDLGRADLTGLSGDADFSYSSLRFAELSGGGYSRRNFMYADLTGANLSSIKGGVFVNAILNGANLTGSIGGNFHGASLCNAVLDESSDGAFNYANLSGASARRGEFYDGRFSGANMSSMDLREANLITANLSTANLTGSDLTDARVGSARLNQALLTRAQLSEADFSSAGLRNANLSHAIAQNTNFRNAYLHNALLYSTRADGANFTGARMDGATLVRADLTDANLRKADLTGANLSAANLSYADFSGADLRNADLRGADLTGAVFAGTNLQGADLRNLNFCVAADTEGVSILYAYTEGAECLPE